MYTLIFASILQLHVPHLYLESCKMKSSLYLLHYILTTKVNC